MRIFITHILPKDKILKYELSMAACNFSYNLIEGGLFDKIYSILPTFIVGDIADADFDGLVYSSWRKKSKILRLFAPIIENVTLFWMIPKEASLWFYNLTILNVTLIVLLKLFKRKVKVNVIVLDYTPTDRWLDCFFLWLTNQVNGTIKLATSTLFTCNNTAILPGVVPVGAPECGQVLTVKKEFLISGVLSNNISMLPMLLKAFSKMPECTLHITGVLNNGDIDITSYTSKYGNLIFHGRVPFEEYLQLLEDIPFLLSTRSPAFPENQCNFPSKIIEALLYNRIIVSTLHYEQLNGIRYFEVPAFEDDFIAEIQRIIGLPETDLLKYANQSHLVKEKFNTTVWEQTMTEIERKIHD